MKKQELTKRYIQEDKRMRDEWKIAEKARLEEENRQIAQFAAIQQQREDERQEAKKEQEEFRSAVQARVSRDSSFMTLRTCCMHYSCWSVLDSWLRRSQNSADWLRRWRRHVRTCTWRSRRRRRGNGRGSWR